MRTIRAAAAATPASWVTSTMVWPPACSRLKQLDDLLAALGVERARRLVGQQQRGLVGQRAGDREPLALAAREHAGHGRRLVADAEEVEQVAGPRLGHLALAPGDDRRQRDVLEHGHALEEVEELEHDADVAPAQLRQFVLGAARSPARRRR